MDYTVLVITLIHAICVLAKNKCERPKRPVEVGVWKHNYKRLDSAVIESNPVSMGEGQIYVYENYFPGYTIKYIHVDNLAVRTCGASATIKSGGIGTSTLLVTLHASTNQEIRSVVDIWGEKSVEKITNQPLKTKLDLKNMKSMYLPKDLRTTNHHNNYYN